MKNYQRIAVMMVVLLSLSMTSGCLGLGDIADAINNAVLRMIDPTYRAIEILDDGIAQMSYESADWQRILEETRDTLIKEGHTLVANDLSNTLDRAVATSGGEAMCYTDFARQRVLQDLMRIRAKLTRSTIDPRVPTVCQVVPDHINMNLGPEHPDRARVTIYGYDFDAEPRPRVFLYNNEKMVYLADRYQQLSTPVVASVKRPAGLSDKFLDVSDKLSILHHYEMVINLGENGIPLSDSSNRIIVMWGNTTLSEVPVVQPHLPKCEEETRILTPTSELIPVSMVPLNHISGDAEFSGHGPQIEGSVHLLVGERGKSLRATLYMSAIETKETNPDKKTVLQKAATYDIYYAPVGYSITSFEGQDTYSIDPFIYSDPAYAPVTIKPGGLIQSIVIVGDTKGRDASRTGIQNVDFAPISVTLRQTQYCTP